MAYDVQMVLLGSSSPFLTASGHLGFPTTFDFFLFSGWFCLGSASRTVTVSDTVPFFSVGVSNGNINVQFRRKQSVTALVANFGAPVHNYRSNVLVSAQLSTNTVQVYVNDHLPSSSSTTWTGSGTFNIASGLNNWDITASGSTAPGAGIGNTRRGIH